MTDAERRAKQKYKKKITALRIELYPTDDDIKNKLESVDTKTGYIKDLIRADIEKSAANLRKD